MKQVTVVPVKEVPTLEEQIRQIVREEIAAHSERRKSEVYLSESHELRCKMGLANPY